MAKYYDVQIVYCMDCRFCEGTKCIHPDNRNPYGCDLYDFCDCGELPPELPKLKIEEI